ncbi:DUF937 domain-containing protein [Granulosicoccus sp. 3-233]|uniref:DUF937 domain-containing protein n=1 Tax=Granulosicoccus sp. 3-233 TaxID=3417969 RepID=UPI003D327244
MSFNLIDLTRDQISDRLLGIIGGILDTQDSQTREALSAALPGLLSGLMNACSQPAGASALLEAARSQNDDVLQNLCTLLDSNQSSAVATRGNSTLSCLLGSNAQGQLAAVIATYAGVSRGNSSTLLGMLTPLIIGVIKRKILDDGMRSNALIRMFRAQRSNIGAAMPRGLADQLQTAGFFDSISTEPVLGTMSTSNETAPLTPRQITPDSGITRSGGGVLKWLLPLVVVAIPAFFWMQYRGEQGDSVSIPLDQTHDAAPRATGKPVATVQTPAQATLADTVQNADSLFAEAVQAAQASMPEGVDLASLTNRLEAVFGSTSQALAGISDIESARTAVENIEAASDRLDELQPAISDLPAAADGPVNAIVSNGITVLKPLIDRVTAIPGVAELVQPVLGPMLETLQELTD